LLAVRNHVVKGKGGRGRAEHWCQPSEPENQFAHDVMHYTGELNHTTFVQDLQTCFFIFVTFYTP